MKTHLMQMKIFSREQKCSDFIWQCFCKGACKKNFVCMSCKHNAFRNMQTKRTVSCSNWKKLKSHWSCWKQAHQIWWQSFNLTEKKRERRCLQCHWTEATDNGVHKRSVITKIFLGNWILRHCTMTAIPAWENLVQLIPVSPRNVFHVLHKNQGEAGLKVSVCCISL